MAARSALLVGATGLVGRHCLGLLLEHPAYASVVTLGRRPAEQAHPRLTHHVVDFDRLEAHAGLIRAHDVFCCLGTTMKQAGSKEAFRKVDYHYPLSLASFAAANGAAQFLLVSALGADPGSMFFYNRVKGEAEAAVSALAFEGVYLFRPALLTGGRTEPRLGEQAGAAVLEAVGFLLRGPLARYQAIPGRDVAAAMVATAVRQPGGVRSIPSDEIREIAVSAA
jgi:uncharacterized protein YbjT (DUF2867 family)